MDQFGRALGLALEAQAAYASGDTLTGGMALQELYRIRYESGDQGRGRKGSVLDVRVGEEVRASVQSSIQPSYSSMKAGVDGAASVGRRLEAMNEYLRRLSWELWLRSGAEEQQERVALLRQHIQTELMGILAEGF